MMYTLINDKLKHICNVAKMVTSNYLNQKASFSVVCKKIYTCLINLDIPQCKLAYYFAIITKLCAHTNACKAKNTIQ